jgi:integrase/recombinase XerD
VLTVRGYVRAIKVFFSWCVYEDLIESNPSAKLVQPKAPHYLIPTLSSEQIEAMLETCDLDTPVGFRNYVLLLVFLDTGMRLSELCNLRVSDVHDRYVKVLGKGRKEREIGIYPEVGKLLWKYIHKYRKPKDPSEPRVFIGRGVKLLT